MRKLIPFFLLVLTVSVARAEDTVMAGVAFDHQYMGYMPGVSSTTLPTYFIWGGTPIMEVSRLGIVLRYKKNGVWVTVP